MTILAITGGTGFVGGHLIDLALAAGHEVRALTRRAQSPRERVTWVEGALEQADSLAALVAGADAVIHLAGAVNARHRADFGVGNIDGTCAMVAATRASGVSRFIQVSSLSAREPQLSDYGWSKREAESVVAASPLAWTIVRPTGVYGPGDSEMRDMFRIAARGLALLPPRGRVSMIAVEDLARLLLALASSDDGVGALYEVDDGSGGMTHAELARAIGTAVGRDVLPIHLPAALLKIAARLDRVARGGGAKLTADRVGYLCHPDWTTTPDRRVPATIWRPTIALPDGLAATARWYRKHGLL